MSTPYHRAAVHLRHADSVVVCAHVRPDGDAIGSVLGLTLALRDAGIAAVPTLADDAPPPASYSFLPGFALFAPLSELEQPDVFVALDTPNFDRLGDAAEMARGAEELIVIDHHPDNEEFGNVNIVDSQMAASAQMVWRLTERLEIDPTPEVALCCYVGLMTDTGRFQFQNTSPDALRDAASMIEAGVDAGEASRMVYQEQSAAALALESTMMGRMTFENGARVVWSYIDDDDFKSTGARSDETEQLPDALRRVTNVDVVVLMRVTADSTRVNLRSKGTFDVGSVARHYGGGGHKPAAGFTYQGTLQALLPDLLGRLPGGE